MAEIPEKAQDGVPQQQRHNPLQGPLDLLVQKEIMVKMGGQETLVRTEIPGQEVIKEVMEILGLQGHREILERKDLVDLKVLPANQENLVLLAVKVPLVPLDLRGHLVQQVLLEKL